MNRQNPGRFLAFEGIDGSGKSTQAQRLLARLQARGVRCRGTQEPSDGPVGAMLRQILTGRMAADGRVIAGLFTADRLGHLVYGRGAILDNLVEGGATMEQRENDIKLGRFLCLILRHHPEEAGITLDEHGWADVRALLRGVCATGREIDMETLERIGRNRSHTELFEREDRLAATREKYLEAFERLSDRETVLTVDADADADTVEERVWAAVAHLFG